jgi:MHS family proline/betaine transporter-like MFS transporter
MNPNKSTSCPQLLKLPNKKTIIAALLGNALEYYDSMLYGFFAASLANVFFNPESLFASKLASMGSFAAGFVMRPLGGVFFGSLGDRLGRKKALALSIGLVVFPTLAIGLLPTYQQIGLLAPILLIGCRLLQGFSLGGESGGVMTFVCEHVPSKKKGIASSFIVSSCYVGSLLGTLIGVLSTLPFMPAWGWRIPFLIGSLIGMIGYYIRTQAEESPEFIQAKALKGSPLRITLQQKKANVLAAMGIAAHVIVPFFFIFIYGSSILTHELKLPLSQVLAINAFMMLLWIIFLLLSGFLADKYGIKNLMSLAAVSMIIFAYPIIELTGTESVAGVISWQCCLSVLAASFAAPSCAFLMSLFPVRLRYSGIGLGYSLGSAFFSCTVPLATVSLAQWTGDPKAPIAFVMLSGVIGGAATLLSKPQENESMPPSASLSSAKVCVFPVNNKP